MFKRPIGSLIAGLVFLPALSLADTPPTVSSGGVTLAECYRQARQISENVGISAENRKLVQEQYRSQIGAILPHIDWVRTQFYQERESIASTSGSEKSALRTSIPESYFLLQQPLFAGFRDWNLASILKSQKEQARHSQQLTDLQLLADVAEAFYVAYALQDAIEVLQETRKLNQNQIDQLNHWSAIGRSRPSEVLSAQTQGASLDAQIEDIRRTWIEARHLLYFLTGIAPEAPLVDFDSSQLQLTLEDALQRAAKRPEILSAMEDLRQAELNKSYARGGHYPVLSFLGRYYTERVGFQEAIDWDALFTLDVPLYEGGSTQAQVRAARSREIIARLQLARVQRDIDRQVRTAYDNYTHSLTKQTAYGKAVDLAQRNYQTQQKEYRLGVISNLELLRLLSDTQNLRRLSLEAHSGARLDDVRLRIAMGEGL